jgi:hypothetical protein
MGNKKKLASFFYLGKLRYSSTHNKDFALLSLCTQKNKGKVVPVLKHHAMKMYGGVKG